MTGKDRRRDRVYLQVVPPDEASARFKRTLKEAGGPPELETEQIPARKATGRILAEGVRAQRSSPHYNASAMDGIAVRAGRTAGASETNPIRLQKGKGFVWVDTGEPLPEGFDSVIKVEETHQLEDGSVEIIAAAAPWQHVRLVGEDLVKKELIAPRGTRLTPEHLGALLGGGIGEVVCYRRPRVAVIPTGDELADPTRPDLPEGAVPEFNSVLLREKLHEQGAQIRTCDPVPDDLSQLRGALLEQLQWADLTLIIAGSSAGREDHTARLVDEVGQVVVHGVALRPGGPVVLGVAEGKPVVGVPGYPVSASLCCELFINPLLARLQKQIPPEPQQISARLSRRVASAAGRREYLRVQLTRFDGEWMAVPQTRGAGNIASLAEADGLAVIRRGSEGKDAGAEVNVQLRRNPSQLKRSILLAGSHDLTLDVLTECLSPDRRLLVSRLGSLGGLMALRRGEAHLAASHLLDPETGGYNEKYIRAYLGDRTVHLVDLVRRQQGLIVAPGNPHGLTGVNALADGNITFINRQRGAGTRVLFDHLLDEKQLEPVKISGYQRQVYSHTAVAEAVVSRSCDAGMGIRAAAEAAGADFIPLSSERFQLVIPHKHRKNPGVVRLLEVINSAEFRKRVQKMGGYDCRKTGNVHTIEPEGE